LTTLIADIEANGLYSGVTQIHCIVTKDKATGKVSRFFDKDIGTDPCGSIEDGVRQLQAASTVVGHNWIAYDARVLRKFFEWASIDVTKIRDTYIRSLMFDPHRQKHFKCPVSKTTVEGRKQIGAHGLENWGYVVGRGKVEHEDWTKFTPEMLHRCVEDVEITDMVDNYLESEGGDWDWSEAELIEKRFQLVMSEQESYGWVFNVDKAGDRIEGLNEKIEEIDKEVLPKIPPIIMGSKTESKQIRKKDGGYHTNFIKWFEGSGIGEDFKMASFVGPYSRVSMEVINLASVGQVKTYLLSIGWMPTEWNYKVENKRKVKVDGSYVRTSPKITEDSFESLEDDTGKLIAQRITLCHRRSQIQGWLNNVRADGRIEAGGNSLGTNTARVSHRTVANVPKADDDVFFGKEMRELFTVPEGYKLVGADLAALEDRLAGHHTYRYDDGVYAEYLLSGDVHQKVADQLGVSRFHGKTCNHAMKYGLQVNGLAESLNIPFAKAKLLWEAWWDSHPSLAELRDTIDDALDKRGFKTKRGLKNGAFIRGMDGRRIYLRSAHSALNARIQNAGSIVHKMVCVYLHEGINDRWIDAHIVGNFHDETQTEVADCDVEEYKELVHEVEQRVNDYFKFDVPMKLDPEVGVTWADTH